MTIPLYYTNCTLDRFEATVQHQTLYQDQPAIVLDRTAFYPTGGGQPHDIGTLNDVAVIDVIKEKQADQILHVLAEPLQVKQVIGQVDWSRRFDLTQQHSGQHILSQAFIQACAAETVGFHLSQDYATIDLAYPSLTEDDLNRAEDIANEIVQQDRPVIARFVSPVELGHLPLRKPPSVSEKVRVVEVSQFDWSACGGTHVIHTGELGLIKIIKQERKKGGYRITFLCGRRALRHYGQVHSHLRDIAIQFRVAPHEVQETCLKQANRLKQAAKEIENLHKMLMGYQARDLIQQAPQHGGMTFVVHTLTAGDLSQVRQLAAQIIQQPKCVALLGLTASPKKGQLLFACSEDVDLDMQALLKQVTQIVGGGGGGSSSIAQGGVAVEAVKKGLAEAQRLLSLDN